MTEHDRDRWSPAPSEGFYDALGRTIKVARTDLGIGRKDLAETAGISYSYLAAIENGRKQPSSQVLLAIADALGLRTHELLESAEGRRVRSLRATEQYPRWLAGASPAPGPPRAATLRAAAPPTGFAEPDAAPAAPVPAEADDRAYLEELVVLARAIPDHDRRLLLDLARKLST